MSSWFEQNLLMLQKNAKYEGLVAQITSVLDQPITSICSEEQAWNGAEQGIQDCLEVSAGQTVRSIVITGFEYGFFIEQILTKMPMDKTAILVLESNIHQMIAAMHARDLSAIFSHGQIIVFVEPPEKLLKSLTSFVGSSFYFYTHRVLVLENPVFNVEHEEYIEFMRQAFSESRRKFQLNLGNSPEDTLIGNLHNTFNLRQMIGSFPFGRLRNRFKNVPAICIAAGPSLAKNMELLKGLQGHALIFACDTIMDKLQKNGIESHFLSALERVPEVYEFFFKNKTYSQKTILLGLSLLYPNIFEEYAGDKVIVARSGLSFEKWINEIIPNISTVNAGSSVAHLNYTIAKELGCDPIILIGQDLAYGEDGHTHVKGTYDEISKYAATAGIVEFADKTKLKTKGYYGGMVETQVTWESFRKWFEERCQENTGTIINATEGGAYIEGAVHMPLSEVIEQYCQNEIDLSPLEEIREYRLTDEEFKDKAQEIYLSYQKQLECNFVITEKLDKLSDKIKKIPSKSNWRKNKYLVVAKFHPIYDEFIKIVQQEHNILNTIQFTLINLISKINRMGEIDSFEEVEIICKDLSNMVKIAKYYLGKTAEIYEIGLKVLDEYSVEKQEV